MVPPASARGIVCPPRSNLKGIASSELGKCYERVAQASLVGFAVFHDLRSLSPGAKKPKSDAMRRPSCARTFSVVEHAFTSRADLVHRLFERLLAARTERRLHLGEFAVAFRRGGEGRLLHESTHSFDRECTIVGLAEHVAILPEHAIGDLGPHRSRRLWRRWPCPARRPPRRCSSSDWWFAGGCRGPCCPCLPCLPRSSRGHAGAQQLGFAGVAEAAATRDGYRAASPPACCADTDGLLVFGGRHSPSMDSAGNPPRPPRQSTPTANAAIVPTMKPTEPRFLRLLPGLLLADLVDDGRRHVPHPRFDEDVLSHSR